MKKYIPFAICILLNFYSFSSTVHGQTPDDSVKLKSFMKKYNLEGKDPMILITLNPDENPAYKAPLAHLHDSIIKYNLTKNVVYLFRSLRPVEADYYFSHNMNFLPLKNETILCDDDFYAEVNVTNNSEVLFLKGNKRIEQFSTLDAPSRLKLKIKYTVQNTLVDSVKLNESKLPVSTKTKFLVIGNKLVLLDYLYNNMTIYEIKTGNVENHLEIKYDYSDLYKTFRSADTSRIGFTNRARKYVQKTFNMPEFSMYNFFIRDSILYIPCSIAYGELNEKSDTAFTRYSFLIKTDLNFKKTKFYYLPYPDGFNITDDNVFYPENDSTFIYSISPSSAKEIPGKKALARFVLRGNKLLFKNFPELELPEYFVKKGINYQYKLADHFNMNGKDFIYFKFSVPQTYAVNDRQIITFPDTSFKDPDSWTEPKKKLVTVCVYPINTASLAYFTNEKGKDYFSVFNVEQNKILFKEPVPERFLGARIAGSKKNYYFLKSDKKDMYLYHFELK